MGDGSKPAESFSTEFEKTVVREAPDAEKDSWRRPTRLDKVLVHLVGTLKDGSKFEDTRESGEAVSFIVGGGPPGLKGWSLAVLTMRKGEVSKFTMGPDLAYGDAGLSGKVPPSSVVFFEIELLSWILRDDVLGDGQAIKSVLEPGVGDEKPEAGDEVILTFGIKSSDGSILSEMSAEISYSLEIDSSDEGKTAFGGLAQILLDSVIGSMRKGEKVEVLCKHGSSCIPKDCGCGHDILVFINLLEIQKTEDVSRAKDGSLIKRRLSEGQSWEKPEDSSQVTLLVEKVQSRDSEESPLLNAPLQIEFCAGRGEVCDALEFAILTMTQGEKAVITASRSDLWADSKLGLSPDLTPPLRLYVTLKSFDDFSYYNLTEEKRLQWAQERKAAAARLFKDGRAALAERHYNDILGLFVQVNLGFRDGEFAEERRSKAAEMKLSCRLNIIACMLKLREHVKARDAATAFLREHPGHTKALYRRASASLALEDYEDAVRDLRRVLEVEPGSTESRRLLAEALQKNREALKKQKDDFGKKAKD
eukprot:TRINITY_DN9799_c4_g1_i1.p1 TRINITY_DN9799_c4_g1~~TRINITY_DN9799_c4_g1_i1.p1  ORF type:complete len:534 (-),score=125.43 TRINITY_DN9799_c4_g1_i1:76-1677(-)